MGGGQGTADLHGGDAKQSLHNDLPRVTVLDVRVLPEMGEKC